MVKRDDYALSASGQEELLSLADLVERLGVSYPTVRRLIARSALPIYRVGRQIRINKAEYEAWLEGMGRKAS